MIPIPKGWDWDWGWDMMLVMLLVGRAPVLLMEGAERLEKEKMGGGAPLSEVEASSRLRGVGGAYWGVGAGPERGALGMWYSEGSNGLGGGGSDDG